jgi:hypothetical protein
MKHTFLKYLLVCFLFILISELLKSTINYKELIYNSLAEKLSSNQIKEILHLQDKWQWVGYIFVPIYILLKTTIISSILYIGIFFFSKKDIDFKNIWNCVIKAEFIFLLVPIFKIIWFYFFQTNYTLEDIQYFYPFSALNIIGYKGLDAWLFYPLQTLNLIEFGYIIYLSYQIGSLTRTNADNGLKIVSYSYVPALLLWVSVIMFFTLNYS